MLFCLGRSSSLKPGSHAIRELDPSVDITLELLGKGEQWIGALEPSTVQAASQLLADLRTALPRGHSVPAAEGLKPGGLQGVADAARAQITKLHHVLGRNSRGMKPCLICLFFRQFT